jgi:hypothetical protein
MSSMAALLTEACETGSSWSCSRERPESWLRWIPPIFPGTWYMDVCRLKLPEPFLNHVFLRVLPLMVCRYLAYFEEDSETDRCFCIVQVSSCLYSRGTWLLPLKRNRAKDRMIQLLSKKKCR